MKPIPLLALLALAGCASLAGTPDDQAAFDESDARALVRFAYFTDQPPAPGMFLHTTVGRNMPPEVAQFPAGRPVTLLYVVGQAGRALPVQGRWVTPDGRVARAVDQTIGPAARPGSWTWQVQTLPADHVAQPGRWYVELLIGGQPAGRYAFTRLP